VPYQAPTTGYPATPGYPGSQPAPYQSTPYQSTPQGWGQSPQLQPYYAEAPAIAKPSPVLGIAALALVVVCAVVGCYSAYAFGFYYGEVIKIIGIDAVGSGNIPDEYVFELGGIMTPGLIATLGGIIGFVLAIIATTKKKGRAFGILGIILGVVAPLLMLILTMVPMVEAL
jgi:hypothetical protein